MVNGFEHIKVVGKRAKKHIRSNAETKKNNEIHNLLEIDCDFSEVRKLWCLMIFAFRERVLKLL